MRAYTFTFRDRNSHTEAEFSLHFTSDDDARDAAREFERHSDFANIEGRHADVLIFNLDRRYRQSAA